MIKNVRKEVVSIKHIVFVIGNYKNGGVAMRATNLANAFGEKGYKATILVTGEISDNVFFEHHKNVQVVSLSDYYSAHRNDADVIKYQRKQQKKLRLLKRVRYITGLLPSLDFKIDTEIRGIRRGEALSVYALKNPESIYIAFGIAYYESAFFALRSLGCKLFYGERTMPEKDYPSDEGYRAYLLGLVSKADGVILQTEWQSEFYKGLVHNYTVINNPVKADLPQSFSGERRKAIINFCRVSREKNLPLLFEAMVKLHRDYPQYILEIYGNTVEKHEEELLEEYKSLIKKLSAEDYIKMLPPSRDIHSIARDCTMFVSSSDFEGLSNSMIEAMAIGLPCVCTDCLGGGAREMIVSGENGLLVPVKDSEALYLSMKRLIEEPWLSEKCSLNAQKKKEELSLSVIADKWIKYIENRI